MSRPQRKNKAVSKAIAERFVRAYEVGMGLTTAEIARRLQYANSTTIQAIRRGDALPDIARIGENIAALANRRGHVLNLHWLITGDGLPFVQPELTGPENRAREILDDDIIMCLSNLSAEQKSAFSKLILTLQ
jgi:hypothetical protein